MRPSTSFEARFWPKVEKTATCWLWTAAKDGTGYGKIFSGGGRANGRLLPAHRVAYELLVAIIPNGLHLDHLCRNRACVNPAHLEPVTAAENNRRAKAIITHCPKGHPLSGDNLEPYELRVHGHRKCRRCRRV